MNQVVLVGTHIIIIIILHIYEKLHSQKPILILSNQEPRHKQTVVSLSYTVDFVYALIPEDTMCNNII